MRNASGHNYWNTSFIMDRLWGRYHIPLNAFLVRDINCLIAISSLKFDFLQNSRRFASHARKYLDQCLPRSYKATNPATRISCNGRYFDKDVDMFLTVYFVVCLFDLFTFGPNLLSSSPLSRSQAFQCKCYVGAEHKTFRSRSFKMAHKIARAPKCGDATLVHIIPYSSP